MATKKTTRKKAAPKKSKNSPEYITELHAKKCELCPLSAEWDSLCHPRMEPTGCADNPLVYILGEFPSNTEDQQDIQFGGKTGAILRNQIPEEYEDRVAFDNAVRCHPPKNRVPTWEELEACRPFHIDDIEHCKPKAILGAGGVALNWAIGESNIGAWRGRRFPVKVGNHECWFYPIFHPSFVFKKGKKYNRDGGLSTPYGKVFQRDIARLFDEIETLPPAKVYPVGKTFDGVTCLTQGSDFEIDMLQEYLNEWDENEDGIGIDIETNGLRPYKKGAKILSIALGTGDKVISVPLHHKQSPWNSNQLEWVEEMLVEFLYETKCRKICHNTTFEQEWFAYFYGDKIVRAGRWEDTKAQGYVIDERQGALRLNHLTLLYYGLALKDQSATNVTDLDNEDLEPVLRYNGGDTKFTHMLFYTQKKILEEQDRWHVYEDQIARVPTAVLTQLKGVNVDVPTINQFDEELKSKLKEAVHQIKIVDEVQRYEKVHGELNINSHPQLHKLLRDYIKADECIVRDWDGNPEKDKKGNIKYTSNKEVLAEIDHPFTKAITAYRRNGTLHSRYVQPVCVEYGAKFIHDDGKIHTNYNTALTSTRRLSSSDPNMQNYPKRADKWIRKYIIPSPGNLLVSVDYGQIEARIIGFVSNDQFLIEALWNRYDIHAEWAQRIFDEYPNVVPEKSLDDKAVFKRLRNAVKNEFVFPSFFGATIESVAGYLGIPIKNAKRLQNSFWKQFSGVKEWQEELQDFYHENHYVESIFGFRRHAPMSVNELINEPIQSSASDIVVDAMNRLSIYSQETDQPQFQALLNIHDDLTFDVPKESLEEDGFEIAKQMAGTYKFITDVIPITVEVAVGENWAEMEEVFTLSSDEI